MIAHPRQARPRRDRRRRSWSRLGLRLGLGLGIAGCPSPATPRDRVLAHVAGDVTLVAAADGSALSAASLRRAVEAARPRIPSSLGCVVDAALASDAVALGADVHGVVIAIATGAHVACPSLSELEPGLWIATIGGGAPATAERSVTADPRWARARRYLAGAPIAVALDTPSLHAIGAIQATPLDGWIALDTRDGAAFERAVRAAFERWQAPALTGKLDVRRDRDQVVIAGHELRPEELGIAVAAALRAYDRPPEPDAIAFRCPTGDPRFLKCADGTHYRVASIATAVRQLALVVEPAIASGDVVGLRLAEDGGFGLIKGDVIRAIDTRQITTEAELAVALRTAHDRVAVVVTRAGRDVVIELKE